MWAAANFHVFISIFSLPKTQNIGFHMVLTSNVPTRLRDKKVSKVLILERRLNGRKPETRPVMPFKGH